MVLGRALSSGDRCQLLHQRLEAGWRKHARVVTGEDGPHTVLDGPVPLRVSQDVEAIVADGCQHLVTDAAWIQALSQLLGEPLPEGVCDGSDHRLRRLGQLRRPVAGAVKDVRVYEARTQDRDAG